MPALARRLVSLAFVCALAAIPAFAAGRFARTPAADLPTSIADLPLVVAPAQASSAPLVIWISGDGGWGEMERDVARLLAEERAPMVGINTLRYFWTERQPIEVAHALDRIVRAFTPAFGRERFVLVGFSFGADMAPLVIDHLSPDVRARLERTVLLSPAKRAAYEVSPLTWFGVGDKDEVGPAISRLDGFDVVCVRGARDPAASCPHAPRPNYSIVDLPGGHTLKGDWTSVARLVLGGTRP